MSALDDLIARDRAATQPSSLDAIIARDSGVDSIARPETQFYKHLGNVAAGALRGAGSIGATFLAPIDSYNQWRRGEDFLSLKDNSERRSAMDSALESMGADPNSFAYGAGKVGGEIAGTAGAGSAVANGLRAIPAIAKTAPGLLNAIESGGLSIGSDAAPTVLGKAAQWGTRSLGGAINGGAQTLMADPEKTAEGAAIGAAIPAGVKIAGLLGDGVNLLARHSLGAATGVGSEAISGAVNAGKAGNTSFLDNMRGNVPFTDVIDKAKSALSTMRASRAEQYRNGMVDISNDKTVLDFSPINKAMANLQSLGSYKGVPINSKSANTVSELQDVVNNWSKLDPKEYHTPEGIDALKKAIGDIKDSQQFGTPGYKAANDLYAAVREQISNQAPTYNKVMKEYAEASETLKEAERSLIGGNKASADTSMRKLQSLMRNNVNTNYGNRLDLAKQLQEQGGQSILPDIAGQAMTSWTPRGISGAIQNFSIPALAVALHNPAVLAAAPFTSPRLMGEALYKYGQASSLHAKAMKAVGANQGQLVSEPAKSAIVNSLIRALTANPQALALP